MCLTVSCVARWMKFGFWWAAYICIRPHNNSASSGFSSALPFPWPGRRWLIFLYFSKKRLSPGTVHAVKLQSFNIPNKPTSTIFIQCPTAGSVAPSGCVTSAAQDILRGKVLWTMVSVSVPDSPSHRSAFLPPHSPPLPRLVVVHIPKQHIKQNGLGSLCLTINKEMLPTQILPILSNFIQRSTHRMIRSNTQKTNLIHKKLKVARHFDIPQGKITLPADT